MKKCWDEKKKQDFNGHDNKEENNCADYVVLEMVCWSRLWKIDWKEGGQGVDHKERGQGVDHGWRCLCLDEGWDEWATKTKSGNEIVLEVFDAENLPSDRKLFSSLLFGCVV